MMKLSFPEHVYQLNACQHTQKEKIDGVVDLYWQRAVGYRKQGLAETVMTCYNTLIGSRLRARGFAA